MRNGIANKLTKYLAKVMSIGIVILLIISSTHSFITYKKINARWVDNLQTFATNLTTQISEDVAAERYDSIRKGMDLIVNKDRDQKLQIKLTTSNTNSTEIYNSGVSTSCDRSYWKMSEFVTMCAHDANSVLTVDVSREIRSLPGFWLYNNIPLLFLCFIVFIATMLVVIRRLLRKEVIYPLTELVQNLEENRNLESNVFNRSYEWKTLSKAIFGYKEKIVQYVQKQNETEKALQKEKLLSEITAQLAHDIRSPLTALDMMASNIPELDDAKRTLIRNAASRIHNIANNLLDRNFNKDNNVSAQMFSSIIRSMIFEKREQYKNKPKVSIHEHVDHQMYGAFSKIELNDFKRMLSNVIDNAVQAISSTGFVRVALTQRHEEVVIEVFDNGKGIPPEEIDKVALKGNTTRKTGSGLGLYFVDQKLKEWGGKLEIESKVGQGTTVRLALKKEIPPPWFVSEIKINEDGQYVVLDDDQTIHEMWKGRILQAMRQNVKLHHFEDEKTFGEWFATNKSKNPDTTYFFDYEIIGQKNSGLDIIEKFNITNNAILITSHYDNVDIQKRCERLGVRMIPKELANFVPIVAQS